MKEHHLVFNRDEFVLYACAVGQPCSGGPAAAPRSMQTSVVLTCPRGTSMPMRFKGVVVIFELFFRLYRL